VLCRRMCASRAKLYHSGRWARLSRSVCFALQIRRSTWRICKALFFYILY
jgi:hypothetical protein